MILKPVICFNIMHKQKWTASQSRLEDKKIPSYNGVFTGVTGLFIANLFTAQNIMLIPSSSLIFRRQSKPVSLKELQTKTRHTGFSLWAQGIKYNLSGTPRCIKTEGSSNQRIRNWQVNWHLLFTASINHASVIASLLSMMRLVWILLSYICKYMRTHESFLLSSKWW